MDHNKIFTRVIKLIQHNITKFIIKNLIEKQIILAVMLTVLALQVQLLHGIISINRHLVRVIMEMLLIVYKRNFITLIDTVQCHKVLTIIHIREQIQTMLSLVLAKASRIDSLRNQTMSIRKKVAISQKMIQHLLPHAQLKVQ